MGPAYFGAMWVWILLGPLGLWAGAVSRYALKPRFGQRVGAILIVAGASILVLLLACALPAAISQPEIWADVVAIWSVPFVSFYVPFAVAGATTNRWKLLVALPISGIISFCVATIFVGLGGK